MNRKLVLTIVLSCLFTTLISATAYAYSLNPFCVRFQNPGNLKYTYTYLGLRNYSWNVYQAILKWNAAANLINCTSGSPLNIYVYSDDYDQEWAGLCRYPNITLPNTCTIKMNEYYIGTNAGKQLNVALHELGHCYGLNHSSSTSSVVYRYVQEGVTDISSDDANGVNAKYN
jgi:hypothetical protein